MEWIKGRVIINTKKKMPHSRHLFYILGIVFYFKKIESITTSFRSQCAIGQLLEEYPFR